MPTGTGLPLCRKYICRGGSCQEQRGIMFLMAIPGGSVLPEWWLSNSGLLAQTSPEYSLDLKRAEERAEMEGWIDADEVRK